MPIMTNFIDTKGACKMTYAEECRLRAQMLLDAADGVEFQLRAPSGEWVNIYNPDFTYELSRYRRKPKKVRHERVVVWHDTGSGIGAFLCIPDSTLYIPPYYKELKRETVFVEVEE